MNNAAKTFDILAISLNISQNYFNNPTNLFLDLHRIKLWDYFNKIVFFM